MIQELKRVAELQLEYSSENTPAMKERGTLIRQDLPELLRAHLDRLKPSMGRFGEELSVEGRDGIGRKTSAPWVRLFANSLSPSATTGFYVVIHFALDGTACFITLGCGASKWDSERGDLIKESDEQLKQRVAWGRSVLLRADRDLSGFPDQIDIGSTADLVRSFEKATVLAKSVDPHTVTLDEFIETICSALELLAVVYEAYSQRADMTLSESFEIDIQSVVNPSRATSGQRQGFGLTGPERKAVELRAMEVVRVHLEGLGYSVTDTSANKPYDFLAEQGEETIKVEVKGTTTQQVDAIFMTSNEVDLHTSEEGATALGIVSDILLSNRDSDPACSGGTLDFHYPWKISDWVVVPKAYSVTRPQA